MNWFNDPAITEIFEVGLSLLGIGALLAFGAAVLIGRVRDKGDGS